jgi:hypothetical protein
MAEIHAPVIAADINDDGKIEMITADVHGNVAAWTAEGEEIWEVHLKSLVPQASFILFLCIGVTNRLISYINFVLYSYDSQSMSLNTAMAAQCTAEAARLV